MIELRFCPLSLSHCTAMLGTGYTHSNQHIPTTEGVRKMANDPRSTAQTETSASVDKKEKPSSSYSAPALDKGLDILEALFRSENGLTQKEIAAQLDRSVSELYRMLNSLVRRDYVVSRNDRFSVTSKMFQLSRQHPPTDRLITEALPLMQELAHQVGFSCDLRIYSMGAQTVIASVNTPSGIGFNVSIGAEIAVAPSASGRILVAFQNAETMELRLAESLSTLSSSDIKAFRKELHDVALKGFASIKSQQYEGIYAVSFPIFDMDRHAIAALSVTMVPRIDGAPQPTRTEVEEALRQTTQTLNTRLS